MAIGVMFFKEEQSQPDWGGWLFSGGIMDWVCWAHVFVVGGLLIGESDGFV